MCANCKVKKENGTVSPSGEAQEGSQDEQLTPEKVSHNFFRLIQIFVNQSSRYQ